MGFQRQEWQEFNYVAGPGQAPPLAAGTSYTRRESARAPVKEDVFVPMAWSLATGMALGLVSIVPMLKWPETFPLWTPLAATSLGAGATWLLLILDWRKMLWRIEEITGADLKDGAKDKPEEKPTVRIEIKSENGRIIQYDDLPGTVETLREVAVAHLIRGIALSRRELAGATSLSEGKADNLLKEMRRLGHARFIGGEPNAGTELTQKGRATFTQMAK